MAGKKSRGKANQDVELEDLDDNQDVEIEDLDDNQDVEIEDLDDNQDVEIEDLDDNQDVELCGDSCHWCRDPCIRDPGSSPHACGIHGRQFRK